MSLKTDKAVFTVALTTILTFLLVFLLPIRSVGIRTIWLLYPNLMLAIGWFGYLLYRHPQLDEGILWKSVLFGLSATATYLPMDWLFSRKVRFIIYRSSDFFGKRNDTDWSNINMGYSRNVSRLLLSKTSNVRSASS